MARKKKAIQLDCLFFPIDVVFIPDAETWKRTIKRIEKVKNFTFPADYRDYPETAGMCTWFRDPDDNHFIVLVTVNGSLDNVPELVSTISHEATHIKQYIMSEIEETKPSKEFEAYVVGYFTKAILNAFLENKDLNDKTSVNTVD